MFRCLRGQASPYVNVYSTSDQSLSSHRISVNVPSSRRTVLQAQHTRPTGFCCGWSVGLKLPSGLFPDCSDFWRLPETFLSVRYWNIQRIGDVQARYTN